MYRVSEKDIETTINDFTVFCNFIDRKKPILSKRRGMLGKKDLFELNSLLHHRKEVAAPNYIQESYQIIDLMFNLLLIGDLYVKSTDDRKNAVLLRTARKDEYDALNIYEQYAFLLETFWIRYDIEYIIRMGIGITDSINNVIATLAGSTVGEELKKGSFSENIEHDPIFSYLSIIILYFDYFGFCKYIPVIADGKPISKYDDSIDTVIPTELGVNICNILRGESILDWNIPWLKSLNIDDKDIIPGISFQSDFAIFGYSRDNKRQQMMRKIYDERKRLGFIPLYKIIQPIFPEKVLNNTVTTMIDKLIRGNYIFKVSLGRDVWRQIMLSYQHNLIDLHLAIQKAFDFDDDHLYSFFMDGKKFSKHAYHSPMTDEGPFVDEVTIGELGLYEGQRFMYYFDYGDSWEFGVQLLKIIKDEVPQKKPKIIEEKGEAPSQYRYYYDDDDEYL